LKTHFWSIGTTDLILCQNHLALFAMRPANLPHSEWQSIAGEIKAWCALRFRIIEIWNTADSDSITINVTGNADPDTVMQDLKNHLQECFQAVA
jgi:hypothetical protein